MRQESRRQKTVTNPSWLPILLVCWSLAGCGPADWRSPKSSGSEAKLDQTSVVATKTPVPDLDKTVSAPQLPQWAKAYIGQNPRNVFPRNGLCVGNTDVVEGRFGGDQPGTSIIGWGWDTHAKSRVGRVILVDINYQIVGAGEGGLPRGDVPEARPEVTDTNTGWRAVTRLSAGPVEAYGVVDEGQALCRLGRLEF